MIVDRFTRPVIYVLAMYNIATGGRQFHTNLFTILPSAPWALATAASARATWLWHATSKSRTPRRCLLLPLAKRPLCSVIFISLILSTLPANRHSVREITSVICIWTGIITIYSTTDAIATSSTARDLHQQQKKKTSLHSKAAITATPIATVCASTIPHLFTVACLHPPSALTTAQQSKTISPASSGNCRLDQGLKHRILPCAGDPGAQSPYRPHSAGKRGVKVLSFMKRLNT